MAVGAGVGPVDGQHLDLLTLVGAVRQRHGHLAMREQVCGVGPANILNTV